MVGPESDGGEEEMTARKYDYDLKIGAKYGKWTVLSPAGRNKYGRPLFICRCDCGKEKEVEAYHLLVGKSKSCSSCSGRKEHPFSYQRLYGIWHSMHERCERKNNRNYHNYGGRGIRVCDEWSKFLPFEAWSKSHGYQQGLSIDRIDNDGDYCPENCRWVTQKVQANNSRNVHWITFNGETKTLSEWAASIGMTPHGLINRLNKYPLDIALVVPVTKGGRCHDLAKLRDEIASKGAC